MGKVELGSGLIAIGREWGTTPEVPSMKDATEFLHVAFDSGIQFFDTAPAYGLSEERLGIFLRELTTDQRARARVATKFGEHWDVDKQDTYVDHSPEALRRSFEQSYHHLGNIALLQLHKTTPELLMDDGVDEAFRYALTSGVKELGASVSDVRSAELAVNDDRLSFVQFPYNQSNEMFGPYIKMARDNGKEVIINRPFQMGKLGSLAIKARSDEEKRAAMVDAYRFILDQDVNGVVLTGTSNIEHLKENITAFRLASEQ